MTETRFDGPLLKLCGLWAHTTEGKGTTYSGKLSAAVRMIVMKNKFKQKDTDPDLVVFLAKAEAKPRTDAPAETSEDKEIPF